MSRVIANFISVFLMGGGAGLMIIGGVNNKEAAIIVGSVLLVGGINLFFTAKEPD